MAGDNNAEILTGGIPPAYHLTKAVVCSSDSEPDQGHVEWWLLIRVVCADLHFRAFEVSVGDAR
jgi:hypothetical protein